MVIEEEEEIVVEPVLSIREIREQEGKVSYLDYMSGGYFLGLAGNYSFFYFFGYLYVFNFLFVLVRVFTDIYEDVYTYMCI